MAWGSVLVNGTVVGLDSPGWAPIYLTKNATKLVTAAFGTVQAANVCPSPRLILNKAETYNTYSANTCPVFWAVAPWSVCWMRRNVPEVLSKHFRDHYTFHALHINHFWFFQMGSKRAEWISFQSIAVTDRCSGAAAAFVCFFSCFFFFFFFFNCLAIWRFYIVGPWCQVFWLAFAVQPDGWVW